MSQSPRQVFTGFQNSTSKLFSDGEFIKQCIVETAGLLCPDTKSKYKQISLSRRAVTRRIEQINTLSASHSY